MASINLHRIASTFYFSLNFLKYVFSCKFLCSWRYVHQSAGGGSRTPRLEPSDPLNSDKYCLDSLKPQLVSNFPWSCPLFLSVFWLPSCRCCTYLFDSDCVLWPQRCFRGIISSHRLSMRGRVLSYIGCSIKSSGRGAGHPETCTILLFSIRNFWYSGKEFQSIRLEGIHIHFILFYFFVIYISGTCYDDLIKLARHSNPSSLIISCRLLCQGFARGSCYKLLALMSGVGFEIVSRHGCKTINQS